MLRRFVLLVLCIAACTLSAVAQEPENALKQYEGKILVLGHPLESSSHRYDADGHVLNQEAEVPWTVYGGVLIEHFTILPNLVKIEGRRVLFLFEKGQPTLLEFKHLKDRRNPPFPESMQLEIRLDHALDSAEQARTILGRVFALTTADLLESMPDYWRKWAANNLTYDPSLPRGQEFIWQAPIPARKALPVPANDDHKSTDPLPTVFRVGPGVSAPRSVFAPEPKFTEIARYERFQGVAVVNVIVGTDGKLHSIRLIRALGLGLDDSARSMLETWRFDPAMREGKPVAVEMNIEVSFNLY
jgi:TonB family protein